MSSHLMPMRQRSIVSTQLFLLYQASRTRLCRRPQETGQPVASVMTRVLQAKGSVLFLGPGHDWQIRLVSKVSRREWLRGLDVGRQWRAAIAVGRGSAYG